jgi:hypothetical protein
MLTRRKEPQRFNSRVAFAVSGGLLLYWQQTPSSAEVMEGSEQGAPLQEAQAGMNDPWIEVDPLGDQFSAR